MLAIDRRWIVLACGIALLAGVGLGADQQPPPPTPAPTSAISGVVTDGMTKRPLPGVVVLLSSVDPL
jgi:hypothetical protein